MKVSSVYSLSLCLLLLLAVPGNGLGDGLMESHHQQILTEPSPSTLAKENGKELSRPSNDVSSSRSKNFYAYKIGMVFSPILRSCKEEVSHLCDELAVALSTRTADPAQPCPFPWMPFERCEVNVCLVFHSVGFEQVRKEYPAGGGGGGDQDWLPTSTDISDECKEAVLLSLRMQEVLRILEEGPKNWNERLVLWQMQANSLAFVWQHVVFGITIFFLVIMISTLVYRNCCKKKQTTWKEERRAVLEAVAKSEKFLERLETLTGEILDPSPFELKWTLEGQAAQLSKLKNQTKVLRAIYSSPELKCQIQEDLLADSEVILGFTPPVDQSTLVRVFDKPKTFLQRWLPLMDFGLVAFMVMEPVGEPIPWIDGLISLYIAWHMVVRNVFIVVFRNKHIRKSTCCVCGTTSVQASMASKKTEDTTGACNCCAGTGVCSVACEICNSRLEKKFPPIYLPPEPPQGATRATPPQPLPKQHGRLL